jgi:restriction system protein
LISDFLQDIVVIRSVWPASIRRPSCIRQLFEKELSAHGGEVRVTQASRDGGVDAVAFDPDPIRGGKIIIQAKRYTNTVDVSSVRDLYGTVMSEGATKGVLVTTSSFGPDAHRFAKDKPITLMDGNNLLFLLAKHGHQARIDLAEAKKLGSPLRR